MVISSGNASDSRHQERYLYRTSNPTGSDLAADLAGHWYYHNHLPPVINCHNICKKFIMALYSSVSHLNEMMVILCL